MKTFLIIGIIIVIAIIVAVKFVINTVEEGKDLIEIEGKIKSVMANIEEIEKGDCSKIPEVESNIEEIKGEFKEACKNPVLKKIIEEKSGEDLCEDPEKTADELISRLEAMKELCENPSVTTIENNNSE